MAVAVGGVRAAPGRGMYRAPRVEGTGRSAGVVRRRAPGRTPVSASRPPGGPGTPGNRWGFRSGDPLQGAAPGMRSVSRFPLPEGNPAVLGARSGPARQGQRLGDGDRKRASGSGLGARTRDQDSEAGLGTRTRGQGSRSGVRTSLGARTRKQASGSGLAIRSQDQPRDQGSGPASRSGLRTRTQDQDSGPRLGTGTQKYAGERSSVLPRKAHHCIAWKASSTGRTKSTTGPTTPSVDGSAAASATDRFSCGPAPLTRACG